MRYNFLISQTETIESSSRYRAARLRLALSLLVVTGIRIRELLPLKMGQVKTLFKESWISIDRSKRSPSSHKAFLTRQGTKIIRKISNLCYILKMKIHTFLRQNTLKNLSNERVLQILLINLYKIDDWKIPENTIQVPYGLAKQEFVKIKIRNCNTYHKMNVLVHVVKIIDDDVDMKNLFNKTFNTISNKQNTGAIPYQYQIDSKESTQHNFINSIVMLSEC